MSAVTPFARVLKSATEQSHVAEANASESSQTTDPTEPAATLPALSSQRSSEQPVGEGLGLLIVKRLCDLLDASLELETEIGRGTTFRVIFPKNYEA